MRIVAIALPSPMYKHLDAARRYSTYIHTVLVCHIDALVVGVKIGTPPPWALRSEPAEDRRRKTRKPGRPALSGGLLTTRQAPNTRGSRRASDPDDHTSTPRWPSNPTSSPHQGKRAAAVLIKWLEFGPEGNLWQPATNLYCPGKLT